MRKLHVICLSVVCDGHFILRMKEEDGLYYVWSTINYREYMNLKHMDIADTFIKAICVIPFELPLHCIGLSTPSLLMRSCIPYKMSISCEA